ncbi:MAG: hypothetical protein M0R06_27040 [Sphaerochaeta sp.]|jgi:hypothetical protein|nr:hypothetical protein [Sphaerochaeta sp.]
MSEVANIYDNGPISPVAKIHENLGILTEGQYQYFTISFIEGVPRSRPMMFDLVALNGAANIGAYTQLNSQLILAIQPAGQDRKKELLHLRWEPVDDVEGQLFELAGHARYTPRGAQAVVTRFSRAADPWLAATTFFVLGQNKDAQIGAFNPNGVALPRARFVAWGYRYIVEPLANKPLMSTDLPAMAAVF